MSEFNQTNRWFVKIGLSISCVRYLLILFGVFGVLMIGVQNANSSGLTIQEKAPDLYDIARERRVWRLYLSGDIEKGDDARVERLLIEHHNDDVEVYLNSPGGDFFTGMEIGRILRKHNVSTSIGKISKNTNISEPGICYSACALAFIGGYYRFYSESSQYGVHRVWKRDDANRDDLDVGQIIAAATGSYIEEMGVSRKLLNFISLAGKDDIYIINKKEQEELRVVNNGLGDATWTFKLASGLHYLVGHQDGFYGEGKLIFACVNNDIMLHAIYESGEEKAQSVVDNEWHHSILIDGKASPFSGLKYIKNDNGYVNASGILSISQIKQIIDVKDRLGYAMQVAPDAPTFIGFNIFVDSDSKSKIREIIRSC